MFVLDIDRGAAIYLKVLALVGGAWNIYIENRDNIPKSKGSKLALNYWPKYIPHKNVFQGSKLALFKYNLGQI